MQGDEAKATSTQTEKTPLSRAELINLAWLASLGILAVNLGGVSVLFSFPRFREGEFGGVYTFGQVADLPHVGSPPVNVAKMKLWLIHEERGVAAFYKVCPHLGCLYSWNDQEFKFICPCHGSQYALEGQYLSGPAPRGLDSFEVRIIDSRSGTVLSRSGTAGEPTPLPDDPEAVIQIDTSKKTLGEFHD